MPAITTGTAHVNHTGNLSNLLSVNIDPIAPVNEQGHSQFTLSAFLPEAGQFSAFAYASGQLLSSADPNCGDDQDCAIEQYFLAYADVFRGGIDLGRLFCLSCEELAGGAANPFLVDENGTVVFFSDLSSFDTLPTAADILDPGSPYYDPVLASSQYFQALTTTAAGLITRDFPSPVPEPGAISLLLAGLLALRIGPNLLPNPRASKASARNSG